METCARCYAGGRLSLRFLWVVAALSCGLVRAAPAKVLAVSVNHVIHPITVEVISRVIDEGQREGAAAILIRLNTPGGMIDATRQVIEKLNASAIPVITYVTPSGGRAASAGFFLLQAARHKSAPQATYRYDQRLQSRKT